MKSGGLFILLKDEPSLDLYLRESIYGFLMRPELRVPSSHSIHYRALADYACARQGTHVFFFRRRKIVYAGQVLGPTDLGAFYLNGTYSPLGREANAPLVWDESVRYAKTDRRGIFSVQGRQRCQPIVLMFEDPLGLSGRQIASDDLYFELGGYPYPLPSNSIQGMGFCTLTPGETSIALDLVKRSQQSFKKLGIQHDVKRHGNPIAFDKRFGVQNIEQAYRGQEFTSESHIEFSVVSNPYLLPKTLRPSKSEITCRQVPICPFKPSHMDRADICYFDRDNAIRNGTIPNRIIEIKNGRANARSVAQVERYLEWLRKVTDPGDLRKIKAYLFAPSFSKTAIDYDSLFRAQISLIDFSGRTIN